MAIDPVYKMEIVEDAAQHQTIIMVTHNPDLGEMADRIIHFRDGKVEEK